MSSELDRQLDSFGEALERGLARAERRRRRLIAGAAVAGVLAAVGPGALVVLPGGRALDPVEAASAAVAAKGQGILHYVATTELIPPAGSRIRRPVDPAPTEVWTTTSGEPRTRVVNPADGRPRYCAGSAFVLAAPGRHRRLVSSPTITAPMERAQRGVTLTSYSVFSRAAVVQVLPGKDRQAFGMSEFDIGLSLVAQDPVALVRGALRDGRLQDAGTSTIAGRQVRRLSGQDGPSLALAKALERGPYSVRGVWLKDQRAAGRPVVPTRYAFLVDAATSAPISLRIDRYGVWSHAGGRDHWAWTSQLTRFTRFERLPVTPANERLLEITLPPSTTVYRPSPGGDYLDAPSWKVQSQRERAAMRRCRAAMR